MRLIDYFDELISLVLFARQDPDLCGKLAGDNLQKKFLGQLGEVKKKCLAEGYRENDFEQALFAVVALADESFLCSGSGLRDDWQHLYLQKNLFDTSSAGNEFFSRMSQIPREKIEILEVYLYCIGLGFKGCYYNNPKKIDKAKSSFIKLLTGDKKAVIPHTIFPASYPENTSRSHKINLRKIKDISFYLIFFIFPLMLTAGVYVFCSTSLSSMLNNIFRM